jgi:diguanylate cyclase (GGDEF)-like protein
VPPELVVVNDEPVAVRLAGQEFPCESESMEAVIPKSALTGFRLSDIPEELTIRPVESVRGNEITIKDDIRLSSFADGSASGSVELVLRRKFWDGDIGLTPYIEAYRQAVREQNDTKESDFQDDSDYILLNYEITIREDLDIQNAIRRVEGVIAEIESRTEQITHRRLDPLMKIFDRGSFDADLAHILKNSNAHPLSLMVVDLDKFKTINDTYGHEAGDEVLVKIAGVLRGVCGSEGVCYRYGGDEMTVLLPKHNLEQATVLAEKVRVGIAELKFEKSPESISASIGVTSYPESTKVAQDIFSDADAMVYQAKDDGGNAVRGAMGSEGHADSARSMRVDINSRVEAVELWMRLTQGTRDHYAAIITNDSDEDVTIEAITMRKDTLYLSEPTKPSSSDDWKIEKHSSRAITWKAKTCPVARLSNKKGANQFKAGFRNELVEVDIVAWGRVLGRRKKFAHTILVNVDYDNQMMSEF